jgi:CBS domain-containing protein
MKIADIMSRDVDSIRLETTLTEAAKKMKEHDIGSLPVTDGQKIHGMLTDRDIVIRAIAQDKDPNRTTAREAMTEKILYVFDDQDVKEAAESMKDQQVRRLVVLNRDKRLVGFVSMGDLSRKANDEHLTASVAGRVAEPAGQHAAF